MELEKEIQFVQAKRLCVPAISRAAELNADNDINKNYTSGGARLEFRQKIILFSSAKCFHALLTGFDLGAPHLT